MLILYLCVYNTFTCIYLCRHLCEFTGLDFEMAIYEHYYEVLEVMGSLFTYIFDGIAQQYKHEINLIAQQYPVEPLVYLRPSLRISFEEGITMLRVRTYFPILQLSYCFFPVPVPPLFPSLYVSCCWFDYFFSVSSLTHLFSFFFPSLRCVCAYRKLAWMRPSTRTSAPPMRRPWASWCARSSALTST
jgi:hypothetical protein